IAELGVADALIQRGAAQRNIMINSHIISYGGGFPDDNTHAVIDKETMADFSSRMYLNPCQEAAYSGNPAGQQLEFDFPELVGYTVQHNGMKAGVAENDL